MAQLPLAKRPRAPVAQWIEQRFPKPKVASPILAGGAERSQGFGAAFPRYRRWVAWLCAAGLLFLGFPAFALAIGSWSGMRAIQRHLPEMVSMVAWAPR